MMIRSPVVRATLLLSSRMTANFAFYKGLLDPSKHIFMNHAPHSIYLDYWPMGQYPEVYLVGSVASKAYQPQVQKILLESLNSRYNINLTEQDLPNLKWDHLFKRVKTQQTPKQFLESVLQRLASEIFVKQSRWTWVKEQQIRLSVSSQIIAEGPKTVCEFLQIYNATIEKLVSVSNFGFAQKIEGEETAQQKHFFRELNNQVVGISDLKDPSKPENQSLINKLMNMLHSA